jgi:hypothetical protein
VTRSQRNIRKAPERRRRTGSASPHKQSSPAPIRSEGLRNRRADSLPADEMIQLICQRAGATASHAITAMRQRALSRRGARHDQQLLWVERSGQQCGDRLAGLVRVGLTVGDDVGVEE